MKPQITSDKIFPLTQACLPLLRVIKLGKYIKITLLIALTFYVCFSFTTSDWNPKAQWANICKLKIIWVRGRLIRVSYTHLATMDLTFTTLWTDPADDKLVTFVLICFPENSILHFETIYMKFQILFSGGKDK